MQPVLHGGHVGARALDALTVSLTLSHMHVHIDVHVTLGFSSGVLRGVAAAAASSPVSRFGFHADPELLATIINSARGKAASSLFFNLRFLVRCPFAPRATQGTLANRLSPLPVCLYVACVFSSSRSGPVRPPCQAPSITALSCVPSAPLPRFHVTLAELETPQLL